MAGPFFNYRALATASYEGDTRLIIWTLAWDNHAVLDRQPIFQSNIFYPARQSLAYNEHLFGLSLFTLPLYAATRNPVLAYNLVWLASFLLNAIAMHTLLRRYITRDLAATAGSLVFTFSFYKMLHAHGHLHLLWTWLLPLSILSLERWCDRPSLARAFAWAAAVGLQALTSWYLAVIVALAQAVAGSSLIPLVHRQRCWSRLWQPAIATTIIALTIVPFAMPYRALPAASRAEVANYSADLSGYLVPPENTWPGQVWLAHAGRGPRWIWGEQTVFLGWIALLLGSVGVVHVCRLRRWRILSVYSTFVVAGMLLSFGPSLTRGVESWTLFKMLSAVPGLDAFRAPARFATLVLLGLSAFSAFGADFLQTHIRRGSALVWACLPLMLVRFPGGKPPVFPIPAIYKLDALASARALVSLPDYRGRPDWYTGADYLYFSTAHWRPIVNGFGRAEPPEHRRVISHMRAFPGPNNAMTMRALGVEYVVFHAARQPADAAGMVQEAIHGGEYDLVARVGTDYLFKVRSTPPAGP